MTLQPCPTCGHPNHDTARFCEECGGVVLAAGQPTPPDGQPVVPPVPAPPYAPVPVPPAGGSDTNRNLLIGALVVLGAVAVILVLLLAGGDDEGQVSDREDFDTTTTSSQPPTTTTTSTTTTSTTTTTTTTTPPAGDDPLSLPAGLFCRDLVARGFSYADSVAYWNAEGQPDRMDADLNGYPCETVYSSADVIAYWGFDPQGGGGGGGGGGGVQDLPSGLYCRDLAAMGYSYADAVGYWNVWGQPDRMDEDLNGYPCETVYPASDVIAYWGFDPP